MGVNKVVINTILIVIPIAAILFFIYLSWQNVSTICWEDLNGSKDAILNSLRKCINNCWKKHDFGSEPVIEDCYVIKLWSNDRPISSEDIQKLDIYVKSYLNFVLLEKTSYKIKIRYNYTGNEISVINQGFCGNKITEKNEECDSSTSTCKESQYTFGSCTEKVCSKECFCGKLNCEIELCKSGIPTKSNPSTDTDWCKFCKSNSEEGECNDELDNDCDGFIDNEDSECLRSTTTVTTILLPGSCPDLTERCPDKQKVIDKITCEALIAGVSPYLMLAIGEIESGLSHCYPNGRVKESPYGALGLMQVIPQSEGSGCSRNDLLDVNKNILCGIKIFKGKCESSAAIAIVNGFTCTKKGSCRDNEVICTYDCSQYGPDYFKKDYSGWDLALRAYNGWGCCVLNDCSSSASQITRKYVEIVNEIAEKYK